MSTDPDTPVALALAPAPHPLGLGTRAFAYVVMCAVSLALLLLIQVRQGQGPWVSLLMVGIGVGGLLMRFRLAPVLLLVLVALRRYFDADVRWYADNQQGTTFTVPDVLRSVAVLGYVIGHYRLQGLSRYIFPPDYRLVAAQRSIRARGSVWHRPQIERRRSVHAMTPLEEPLLILSLPAFAVLGQLAWFALAQPRELLEWDPWVVRLAAMIGTLVLGMSIVAGILGTWRRRRMTPAEAHVMMQDSLWRETRGEQRWFTRWLAWFWLKERERKEQP
jgi:hypothetical protein